MSAAIGAIVLLAGRPELETWAAAAGIERLWVAMETAGRAVAFYERCGYECVEELGAQRGERVTVLAKGLTADGA